MCLYCQGAVVQIPRPRTGAEGHMCLLLLEASKLIGPLMRYCGVGMGCPE